MHNLKYLFLSFGLLMMALGAINFYNQNYPPQVPILEKIYYFIHGRDKPISFWLKRSYNYYYISRKNNNYFYHLTSFEITSEDTIFHFRVGKFSENEKIQSDEIEKRASSFNDSQVKIKDNDPFPNPVMVLHSDRHLDEAYLCKKQYNTMDENGDLIVDLYFPSIENSSSDIQFWCDYKNKNYDSDRLFWLSTPAFYGESGTNIWGLIFFLGTLIFLFAAKINPLKTINNRIIESERDLDYAKKKSIERVTDGVTLDRLAPDKKYRYDTMIEFYNKAQNLIYESYKLYSEKSIFSFEILFKSIVIIAIFFLSASILFSGFSIFLPDTFQIFRQYGSNFVNHSSESLEERLSNLEYAKHSLTLILIGVFALGIFSTITTYAINVWRIRSVARSLVGKKIKKFTIKIRLEIENRTAQIDNKLTSLKNKFSSIENSVNNGVVKINEVAVSSQNQFYKIINSEKKIINRELNLHKKQFIKNINKIFRR